jgi:preprotein translocase subunit SecE
LDQADETEQEVEILSDSRRRRRGAEVAESGKDRSASTRAVKTQSAGSPPILYRIPVVRSIATYFKNVFAELGKVTWPTRDEATRLTWIVLGVTAFFSVTLGALSLFFSWWFQQAFHANSEDIFLIVGIAVAILAGIAYTMFRRLEV